ncbi:LLM class flavin-dependent oxidoreductase [Solwaraspora sp. WMMD1047]|uniref:LLM class flavin-dependent oxidoreductase n=1 Tax=Solwaraspora sp. WMMD1047 TaxID=3016102 RepID=UPI002416CC1E|nr:LLM class flavin-dependent oxidoreductase [Solwaraspora sp. WMMD1047]MDG4829604.1 LLM class flavin-dependent oxidoreductase [Solwaraspora sp. WMMD1047]
MRVGIVILADQRWSDGGWRWRRAEEYGFDHAWTYDHLGWRDLVDGPWFDAVPTLTAAAVATSRIRLGTLVASPNFRHPVHFAREITALDDISAGRLTVGVGAGGLGFDANVLGRPELSPRARADRFAEFVDLLDLLLRAGAAGSGDAGRGAAGPGVDWAGEHYAAVDARTTPGCRQRPRVPFLVAANGPRAMRLAARYGQGWVTTGAGGDDLDAWWAGVAGLARRFDETLAAVGRDRDGVDRFLSLDSAPVYSMSSVAAFTDAIGRAGQLGFTDVVTHWPRPSSWYAGDEAVLETVASDVLPELNRPQL